MIHQVENVLFLVEARELKAGRLSIVEWVLQSIYGYHESRFLIGHETIFEQVLKEDLSRRLVNDWDCIG